MGAGAEARADAPRCPACDADRSRGAGEMRACEACGLRFAHPLRAGDAAWYAASAVYAERHDVAAPPPLRRLDWAGARFFARLPEPGRVLDLGCSSGDFLAHAAARDWDVHGRELTAAGAALARERHGADAVEQADALAPWPEEWCGAHDAATAFELLEHVADPRAVLAHLAEAVRPGGRVVVSVPRADRRPALFDPVVDAPPHHLTLWTPRALEALLVRAGLRDVELEARPLRPQDLYLHYAWRRERAGRDPLPRPLDLAVRGAAVARVAVRRAARRAVGHTLLAVGRRPE